MGLFEIITKAERYRYLKENYTNSLLRILDEAIDNPNDQSTINSLFDVVEDIDNLKVRELLRMFIQPQEGEHPYNIGPPMRYDRSALLSHPSVTSGEVQIDPVDPMRTSELLAKKDFENHRSTITIHNVIHELQDRLREKMMKEKDTAGYKDKNNFVAEVRYQDRHIKLWNWKESTLTRQRFVKVPPKLAAQNPDLKPKPYSFRLDYDIHLEYNGITVSFWDHDKQNRYGRQTKSVRAVDLQTIFPDLAEELGLILTVFFASEYYDSLRKKFTVGNKEASATYESGRLVNWVMRQLHTLYGRHSSSEQAQIVADKIKPVLQKYIKQRHGTKDFYNAMWYLYNALEIEQPPINELRLMIRQAI